LKIFANVAKLIAVVVALTLAARIAWQSSYNTHPDEYAHIDGFQYFENHWWPPDYGSDAVVYSGYGWSRVYTGELVYCIYGKIGKLAAVFSGTKAADYRVYRMLNVGLLALTLLLLFFGFSGGSINPGIIGAMILCIPQVLYIYSYANSDAWGISLSIFLFVLTLKVVSKPIINSVSWKYVILFGVLSGLLLASKTPYVLALILPLILLSVRIVSDLKRGAKSNAMRIGGRILVIFLLVAVIVAPLRIVYPLMQSHAGNTVVDMREVRAVDGYRPSDPAYPTYQMAQSGVTYSEMLQRYPWTIFVAASSYGMFGYMNVISPIWVYLLAYITVCVLVIINLSRLIRHRGNIYIGIWLCLIASPIILAANLYGVLFASLHIDFQPQGRYLMASLIPLSFILAGDMYAVNDRGRAWLSSPSFPIRMIKMRIS
jgi:uncharacterized membrane protein